MVRDSKALSAFCVPRIQLALQTLLLATTLFVPLTIMSEKSVTYDEVTHLPAGFSYLTTGSVKLNPQHPPLIKEICALPLLFLGPTKLVERKTLESQELKPNYEWEYGRKFLFSQDADRMLFWGRVPAVLLSVCLAGLIATWTRELWGTWASVLALVLYAFDPTITAHSQFVTTDVGLAFFSTLFLYVLRKYLQKPSVMRLALSGGSLGLAMGSKFSAVVLLPIAAMLVLLVAITGPKCKVEHSRAGVAHIGTGHGADISRRKRLIGSISTITIMTVMALLVIWVIYLCPADPFIYLKGLRTVNRDHDPSFPYYLMGTLRPGGWWSYFLIAWLIKTPIPAILLFMLSIGLFLAGKRAYWLDELLLILPALAIFCGYSLTGDNIGIRYLIPCFPFFAIFTARVLSETATLKRIPKIILTALLGWYLAEFVTIYPDHLSYFNQIAGGYQHGPAWLDDSNVDWGQGLIQLRQYLQRHNLGTYSLYYFGSGDPEYYGIPKRNLSEEVSLPPPPGVTLILSGHYLARLRARSPYVAQVWLSSVVPKAIVGHAYYVYGPE